jgi:phycocyanin-associated rod protein
MKVSAGTRGTGLSSSRQVALTVTGVSNNDSSRTADMVMNVPYTRMNETMRMVQRMGGKIVGVAVNGGDLTAAKAPRQTSSRSSSSKAKTEG